MAMDSLSELTRLGEFPEYSIDKLGNVYSHKFGKIRKLKPFLAGFSNSDRQYPYVSFSVNGKLIQRQVSHLVLLTFVGPRPHGLMALHKNDDQFDNRPENLYWGTKKENGADCSRNGRVRNQLLTAEDVVEIRKRLKAGAKVCDLADEFLVTRHAISSIKRNKSWRHVQ